MSKKLLRKKLDMYLATLKRKRPYYCEVEYLESTGTQYISTGLLSTANSKVDCVFGFSSMESGAANNVGVFGGRNYTTSNTFTFFKIASGNPQYFRFDYNGQATVATANQMAWNTTSKYRFKYDGTNCITTNTTTGESVTTPKIPASTFTSYSIYLFAVNTAGGKGQYLSGRIYRYWYTDGTNTIDLIPVLDWNYTPCMYDKISGQFFYNQGAGDFLYGREIHYVNYIESTGTQYIDTGVKLTNNHSVELDYQLTQASQSRAGLYGNLATARYGTLLSPSNQYLEFGYGTSNLWYQMGLPDTNRHVIKQVKNNIYLDSSLLTSFTYSTFSIANTAPLGSFGYTNYTPAKSKYYGSKWWYNDDLIRDYKPAIDENGVAFWFDKVSHSIYDNAGTDAFKYPARETEYTANAATKAYIDLGVKYKPSMSIRGKFTRDAMGASGSVLLVTNNTTNPLIYFPALNASAKTDRYVWRRNGYTEQNYYYNFSDYPITQEISLDAINDTLSLNGTLVLSGMITAMGGYSNPYESTSNLMMFSIAENYAGNGKIYYLQIDDGTTPVFDLIPAYQDGQAGFYNKIDGTFFGNVSINADAKLTAGRIIESEWE